MTPAVVVLGEEEEEEEGDDDGDDDDDDEEEEEEEEDVEEEVEEEAEEVNPPSSDNDHGTPSTQCPPLSSLPPSLTVLPKAAFISRSTSWTYSRLYLSAAVAPSPTTLIGKSQ